MLQAKQIKVTAIVVTRNRLKLLKKCIDSLKQQSRPPDSIIVIDNASDDGTTEWLEQREELVVHTQGNLGGAGGFWRGIKEAYESGHDWFWCMDDDTIPEPDALRHMLETKQAEDMETGLLCSLVFWKDGSPHDMNIPVGDFRRGIYRMWDDPGFRNEGILEIKSCSFVSALVARRAVEAVGLPLKEFFIWLDDVEFTERITGQFKGWQVLRSVVLHDTANNTGVGSEELSEVSVFKYKHFLRNQIYLNLRIRRSLPARILVFINGCVSFRKQVLGKVGFKSTCVLLKYMLWGLFFNPRIDFPDRPESDFANPRH